MIWVQMPISALEDHVPMSCPTPIVYERARIARIPATRGDAGFTLVELIAVFVVTAILLAVSVKHLASARSTGAHRSAVATARAYQDAIEAFMVDNGNQVPAVNTADWPNANRSEISRGPLDAMVLDSAGKPRPYLKGGAPEDVGRGLVSLVTPAAPASTVDAKTRAVVEYSWNAQNQYFLRVYLVERGTTTRESGSGARLECVVTNAPDLPAGKQSC